MYFESVQFFDLVEFIGSIEKYGKSGKSLLIWQL